MVGLTAAITVIAMAARSPLSHSTPVDAVSARAPVTALFVLLLGAGSVVLAALAILAWAWRGGKRDDEHEPALEPAPVNRIWKLVAILLALALGAALVGAAVLGARTAENPPGRVGVGGAARPLTAHPGRHASGTAFVLASWLPWTVLAIVVVAVAAGIGLLLHRRAPMPDARSQRTAARAAVQAAIGSLESAADPRSAVIAAYAAMQGTLAEHGVVPSPAEAPREYLRRVLVTSSAAEREASTLTGLFEEARFSAHPIPERVRDRALSALRSLRARLQGGAVG